MRERAIPHALELVVGRVIERVARQGFLVLLEAVEAAEAAKSVVGVGVAALQEARPSLGDGKHLPSRSSRCNKMRPGGGEGGGEEK